MQSAPRIEVTAPLDVRAEYLVRTYANHLPETDGMVTLLKGLSSLHPAERIEHWITLAKEKNWPALATELMRDHYDPRYTRVNRRAPHPQSQLAMPNLSPETLSNAAAQIADLVAQSG